ncbi:MAG: TIGR02757 family protein [Bacteroidales bacterium]
MNNNELKTYLDSLVEQYNHSDFIAKDPISIPHQFTKLQDIEITGFWTAILSWGLRKTIINKANLLFNDLMEGSPYDFIMNHHPSDLKRVLNFKHSTFNATDTLYFIEFFKDYYSKHKSLEDAFTEGMKASDKNMLNGLIYFHNKFFALEDAPQRTRKHVSTPARKSACKRINMFLRWMVRNDNKGVDFGLWKNISPNKLLIPLDVHVERTSIKLGLIKEQNNKLEETIELTNALKTFDPADPVKYDFALFGIGVMPEGLGIRDKKML